MNTSACFGLDDWPGCGEVFNAEFKPTPDPGIRLTAGIELFEYRQQQFRGIVES